VSEPTIWLGQFTRREFRERVQSGEVAACILPVAAIEQHLEHLALEHDWRSVNVVAEAVARRLAPRVIVAQGLMAGISEHHMRHPGTLSLRPGTFLTVLNDLVESLVRAGFRHVLVLNGHGGNIAACQAVWDQMLRLHPVNLHFLSYWDVLTADDARELLRGGNRVPDDLPGHAQEFETAIALAAFPENVRSGIEQADPMPGFATAATGQAFLERISERVARYLEGMIDGRRQAERPEYYP
jgi:creatinine amidohydrolase